MNFRRRLTGRTRLGRRRNLKARARRKGPALGRDNRPSRIGNAATDEVELRSHRCWNDENQRRGFEPLPPPPRRPKRWPKAEREVLALQGQTGSWRIISASTVSGFLDCKPRSFPYDWLQKIWDETIIPLIGVNRIFKKSAGDKNLTEVSIWPESGRKDGGQKMEGGSQGSGFILRPSPFADGSPGRTRPTPARGQIERVCTSASVISRIICSKVIEGSQPRTFRALAGFPIN